MGAQLAVNFTGLRFENPFLLSSAPPTESDTNIMRAFDAGWGGVVTKTIGLHPGRQRRRARRRSSSAPRPTADPVDAEAARHGAAFVVELGADFRQAARLVGCRGSPGSRQAYPDRILVASIMAGSGSDEELRNWQTLAKACQDEGADALELNLSCPHMDRKDMGSNIGKDTGAGFDRHAGREGSGARAGLGQAHAVHHRHRRRSARRRSSAARMRSSSSNTFPSLPLDRSRDARLRDERRWLRVERRPRRTGHSAAVAGEDGAAHEGVSRRSRSPGLAASPTSRTRSTTSCSGAARCRCARRRCSITRSGRA